MENSEEYHYEPEVFFFSGLGPEDTEHSQAATNTSFSVPDITTQNHHNSKKSSAEDHPEPEVRLFSKLVPEYAKYFRAGTNIADIDNRPPPRPKKNATKNDAKRYNIPTGYSLDQWDPREEPIFLLGSVFDSYYLGQWIFDWATIFYGPGQPMSLSAARLWDQLYPLWGIIADCEDSLPKLKGEGKQTMVKEFIERGRRLTSSFVALIMSCQQSMLEAASVGDKEIRRTRPGIEFVERLFGFVHKLKQTEEFMHHADMFIYDYGETYRKIVKKSRR